MLKLILFGTLFVGFFDSSLSQCDPSPTTASGTHAPSEICSGQLIFEENFDELDTQIWDHEVTLCGGRHTEFQWYTNSRYNSWAEDGILNVRPTLVADEEGEDFLTSGHVDLNGVFPTEVCNNPTYNGCEKRGTNESIINPIKSARLRTAYSFNFKYGKVEVRAKFPAGDWLFPAIWLRSRWNKYGGSPKSGEIDIIESRGNRNLTSGKTYIGTQQGASTLHWGPDFTWNKFRMTQAKVYNDTGFDNDFHIYQLLWDESGFTFSVDDEEYAKFDVPENGFWDWGDLDESGYVNPWRTSPSKSAPFDEEYYFIINVAVGGTSFFSDSYTNAGGKPWKDDDPYPQTNFWNGKDQWLPTWKLEEGDTVNLKVDYVKVWAI